MEQCKICNTTNNGIALLTIEGRNVLRCQNCELEWLSPQLNDAEITALYSENYYKAWGIKGSTENSATLNMKKATARLRIALLKKHITSGNMLDVGCANGYFLEAAVEQGFQPYGVELSEYSSGLAKQKFGASNIYHGILETCEFNESFFDAINMADLLEHVKSPEETLNKARQLLKPKGVLIITTPDSGSFSKMVFGKRWPHYKLEHFFYFNTKNIEQIADKCGLKLIEAENSKKALNLAYLNTQYKVYPHWFFTPAFKSLNVLLPKALLNYNFYVLTGEITVLLTHK